jgi:hypothetical protein
MIGLICLGDRFEEGDKVERCCKQGENLERSFKQVERIGEMLQISLVLEPGFARGNWNSNRLSLKYHVCII